MRSKFLIALGAVAALGLLWGCGDDEEDNGTTPAQGGAAGAAGAAGSATGGTAGAATGGTAGSATGGAAGSATGGAAGEAGAATGGAAGEAGAAGAATGGAAGSATGGAAGAAGATCVPDPASHTDCQVAGSMAIGHMPGKDKAKTNCVGCHTADLGKAAKTNCWSCHDPTAATNLHNVTKGGQLHKQATDPAVKGATNVDCAGCHQDTNSLAGNTCTGCHAAP